MHATGCLSTNTEFQPSIVPGSGWMSRTCWFSSLSHSWGDRPLIYLQSFYVPLETWDSNPDTVLQTYSKAKGGRTVVRVRETHTLDFNLRILIIPKIHIYHTSCFLFFTSLTSPLLKPLNSLPAPKAKLPSLSLEIYFLVDLLVSWFCHRCINSSSRLCGSWKYDKHTFNPRNW